MGEDPAAETPGWRRLVGVAPGRVALGGGALVVGVVVGVVVAGALALGSGSDASAPAALALAAAPAAGPVAPDEAQAGEAQAGAAVFKRVWVAATGETPAAGAPAAQGLGPLYNARACEACHARGGRAPSAADGSAGAPPVVLRVSIPAGGHPLQDVIPGWNPTAPDPVYGWQLQDGAAPGHAPEHRLGVTWAETVVALSEGESVRLRRPTWTPAALGYGPLHPEAMLSARLAPPLFGVGLLEAIPEAAILALADPEDSRGDGISGRPSVVWSAERGGPALGRFGWKGATPSLRAQAAGAFSGDMGLSTPVHPAPWGDCTAAQAACRAGPHGGEAGGPEVSAADLDRVAAYLRSLPPSARRGADEPVARRGEAAFHAAGCAACHHPAFEIADPGGAGVRVVAAYTDLLLHDMGEGLADGRPEGVATGREWRTAPLWGLGAGPGADGGRALLHDGRARSILEAILWHGGEAAPARDAVAAMPRAEREALLRFLESL